MIVVISDLHLNDGTVCTGTDAGAAEVFWENLKDQVNTAGKRSDGTYKAVESLELIMLGDIFDFIRSDRWLAEGVRPWDPIKKIAPTLQQICQDIMSTNAEFLEIFRKNTASPIIVDGGSKVPVNLHYMVGNHDWMLHHQDPCMDFVRQLVTVSMGLSTNVGPQFCWTVEESKYLTQQCKQHRTYVRHGDIHDSDNYHTWLGRDASSMGDAIVVEFVTAWPRVCAELVASRSNTPIDDETMDRIKEIDNIRPSSQSPIYARRVIDAVQDPVHKKAMTDALKQCTDALNKSEMFKNVLKNDPLGAIKFYALGFFHPFIPIKLISLVTKIADNWNTKYAKAASKEKWIKQNLCDFVIYGHTHLAQTVGIGTSVDAHDKLYINAATWRPMNSEITIGDIQSFPYFHQKVMTWVAVYTNGERRGKTHEVWNGQLGLK